MRRRLLRIVPVSALLLVIAAALAGPAAARPSPLSSDKHRQGHHTPVQKPLPPLPVVPSPSAAHPLTIVEIGDSLGEDLGIGMQAALAGVAHVSFEALAIGDTGLADTAYYDWQTALAKDLATYDPAIVVVMLGGNDCQSFYDGDTLENPGTASFDAAYSARVGALMAEATAAKARVMWVGMPIMQDPTFSACMAELDADYSREAAAHRGVTYYSTWALFQAPGGGYAEYLSIGGSSVEVRDPDGVHIDPPGGTDLIGSAVVKAMEVTYAIKL